MGLDGYFKLDPWGIELQRAYELMTTINQDGIATLENKEGEEVHVQILEALISEALKFPSSSHKATPSALKSREKGYIFGNP